MFQIPQVLKFTKLFHVFSNKSDGNMANSINGVIHDFGDVLKNRKKFLKSAGVDINKTICMWVTHGDEIIEVDPKLAGISMRDYGKAVKVDGLMTNKKGLYLFLLIADCLPIIIYDPVKEAVSVVHAGWKGVDLEIAKKAIKKFRSEYKSKMKDLIVGIGPCARKESFIKENPEQLNDPRWKGFITPVEYRHPEFSSGSKASKMLKRVQHDKCNNIEKLYNIDLIGFTKKQLIDSGVKKENIFDCGIDTVKDKKFFSHVREHNFPLSQQGRFACVVGLSK